MTGRDCIIKGGVELLQVITSYVSAISCILSLLTLLIKPNRERIFGAGEVRAGQQCLLRSEIVRTYYRNLGEKRLRQYEYENLSYCYAAYRQLGGNSFAEHIYHEMQDWDVIQ